MWSSVPQRTWRQTRPAVSLGTDTAEHLQCSTPPFCTDKQLLNCKYHDSISLPEGLTATEAGKGSR